MSTFYRVESHISQHEWVFSNKLKFGSSFSVHFLPLTKNKIMDLQKNHVWVDKMQRLSSVKLSLLLLHMFLFSSFIANLFCHAYINIGMLVINTFYHTSVRGAIPYPEMTISDMCLSQQLWRLERFCILHEILSSVLSPYAGIAINPVTTIYSKWGSKTLSDLPTFLKITFTWARETYERISKFV